MLIGTDQKYFSSDLDISRALLTLRIALSELEVSINKPTSTFYNINEEIFELLYGSLKYSTEENLFNSHQETVKSCVCGASISTEDVLRNNESPTLNSKIRYNHANTFKTLLPIALDFENIESKSESETTDSTSFDPLLGYECFSSLKTMMQDELRDKTAENKSMTESTDNWPLWRPVGENYSHPLRAALQRQNDNRIAGYRIETEANGNSRIMPVADCNYLDALKALMQDAKKNKTGCNQKTNVDAISESSSLTSEDDFNNIHASKNATEKQYEAVGNSIQDFEGSKNTTAKKISRVRKLFGCFLGNICNKNETTENDVNMKEDCMKSSLFTQCSDFSYVQNN